MLRSPSVSELHGKLHAWKPNFVYFSSGIEVRGTADSVNDIVLKALSFPPKAAGGAQNTQHCVVSPSSLVHGHARSRLLGGAA